MKIAKVIISILLVFVTVVTGIMPCAAQGAADGTASKEATQAITQENSGASSPLDNFKIKNRNIPLKGSVFYDDTGLPAELPLYLIYAIGTTIRYCVYFLSGNFLYSSPDNLEVICSEDLMEIFTYINENSALNWNVILTSIPDVNDPAEIVGKMFSINTEEYRAQMYEKRDEAFQEGNELLGNFYWLVGVYMSRIESAYLYLIPYNGPGTDDGDYYEISLILTYSDGGTEEMQPGIVYNKETGKWCGSGSSAEGGMMGSGFDFSTENLLVTAPMYCWMRQAGFCIEYDLLCYVLPIYRYRTRRFKFDYGDKEWMIQCWKGNYMCTNGGEVGIYNREAWRFGSAYDVIEDEDRMPMSLKVLHGDDVIVDIAETEHWWINGFTLAKRLYQPYSLTEIFTITFPDEEMMNAFCKAVDNNVYHDVVYTVEGLKVTCLWG